MANILNNLSLLSAQLHVEIMTNYYASISSGQNLQHHLLQIFIIVAIDIPGGKRSLVKNIIAQTTILKRAIKK